jgi:hypothetical protein
MVNGFLRFAKGRMADARARPAERAKKAAFPRRTRKKAAYGLYSI